MNELHEARMTKLRKTAYAAGLDLLIVYSNGRHTFLDCEPILYACGFKPAGPHCALLLPGDDEESLVVSPGVEQARAAETAGIADTIGTDDFPAEFERLVAHREFRNRSAGIIGYKRLSKGMHEFLSSQFVTPPVAFDDAIDKVAAVRDELELSCQSQAAEIADSGFERLVEVCRPGMTEFELAAEIDCHMKSQGADDNFQLLSTSQHNLAMRPPMDRRLDVGDVILGEISPSVNGQFVQICRTAVLGPASDLQREKHQILVQAMLAGMKAGKAGAKVSEVTRAVNGPIVEAGYEDYCRQPYMRVRGHGFGMGSMMPGGLSSENDTVLEVGMTFVLHPNQYVPETGYLLVGEPVMVTAEGLQPLTKRAPGLAEITL